jgi:Ribonuclease E/G family
LTEWFYEDGIGEERAILFENGHILEARIQHRGSVSAGLICAAKLVKKLDSGKRGIAMIDGGHEVMLQSVPAGVTEGTALTVEITRAAIDEKTRFKLPLARHVEGKALAAAPTLRQRIGEAAVCGAHQKDYFAEYGWHELTEEAQSGEVLFAGGSLIISVTPAMILIDVDGDLPNLALAIAAARAAADAIRRLDLQGSIGIDFPTLQSKPERILVADTFDAAMHGPFERTAINGFGFLHLVKKRTGPSLPELFQHHRTRCHAAGLLRMAERQQGAGLQTLVAHPAVTALLDQRGEWIAELARRTGRAVALRADPKLNIGGYYAE